MNLDLASRRLFATLVAALAGVATLGLYEAMVRTGTESPAAQQVVQLERVVVVGKRAPAGGDALLTQHDANRIEQLPRVVIEGRSSIAPQTRVAAAPASCIAC